MKNIAQRWDLERNIKYSHKVKGAYWQNDRSQWRVVVEHNGVEFEDFADVLISAQGFLK